MILVDFLLGEIPLISLKSAVSTELQPLIS